jgi:hypothetical protein
MDNQKNQENAASDFSRSVLEIAPGLYIPDKIPFSVRLQVEEVSQKNWQDLDWGNAKTVAMLVYYMAKTLEPKITEVELNDKLAEADMALVTAALEDAFTTKNLKNYRRQGIKRSGNLKE